MFRKNVLAIPHGLIKIFHLQQIRFLKLSMVQRFLSRLQILRSRWFLLSNQEKAHFPFNVFTARPKCIRGEGHACLNLVCSVYYGVNIYRLVKACDLFLLLLFLVSFVLSATTSGFPHFLYAWALACSGSRGIWD